MKNNNEIASLICIICFLVGCNDYPKLGTREHLNRYKETYQSIFKEMQKSSIITVSTENGVPYVKYTDSKIQNHSNEVIFSLLRLSDTRLVHIDTIHNKVSYKIGNEMCYILIFSKKEKIKTYNYPKARLYQIENDWYCWQTTQFGQLAPIPNQ